MDALPDYELIELLLFRSLPRGDVKPLAKALLARFGSLGAVLAAPVEALRTVPGVGEAAALDLRLLGEAAVRVGREAVSRRAVISSWDALLAYVKVALANAPREQFRVLFLDRRNQLIADEVLNEGTVDHAPVYPREVMRRALELSSSAVILVHNHPSGDPTPSLEDKNITQKLVSACKLVGIRTCDHVIIGKDNYYSFVENGLI